MGSIPRETAVSHGVLPLLLSYCHCYGLAGLSHSPHTTELFHKRNHLPWRSSENCQRTSVSIRSNVASYSPLSLPALAAINDLTTHYSSLASVSPLGIRLQARLGARVQTPLGLLPVYSFFICLRVAASCRLPSSFQLSMRPMILKRERMSVSLVPRLQNAAQRRCAGSADSRSHSMAAASRRMWKKSTACILGKETHVQ